MANPVKKLIDSVLFAGLKPATPGQAPSANKGPLGRLWAHLDNWVSGGASDDPLYLSNRTWRQKLRMGLLLGIPGLVLVVGLVLVFAQVFVPQTAPPKSKEATTAELVSKVLPDVDKSAHIQRYTDAEVVEIGVDQAANPPRIRGKLRNDTNHSISVEFVADLTDIDGARVGAVAERVLNTPPKETALFDFPIKSTTASIALVREIRTLP